MSAEAEAPPAPAYHPRFDRGGNPQTGANLWNAKPPDGLIALGDVSSLLRQWGHVCSQSPTEPIYPDPPPPPNIVPMYTYDAENRLVSQVEDGVTTDYTYDAQGPW